eukprot:13607611-Alexandrium_andersonii.AAC.1
MDLHCTRRSHCACSEGRAEKRLGARAGHLCGTVEFSAQKDAETRGRLSGNAICICRCACQASDYGY